MGRDALLTAGHCLWDPVAEDWAAFSIRVVPGKDGDFEPFGSQYAEDWWVPDAYAETGLSDWDWGVIHLPNDQLSRATGWLSVSLLETDSLDDDDFLPAIVGDPGDKAGGTMWGHFRPAFAAVEDFRLFYDIDTAPGQSGSAIWSVADGPYLGLIVGIHTSGGLLNSGQRIDQELLDDLLAGCDAMGCSISVHTVVIPDPPPSGGPSTLPFRSYGPALARD
jgi:V8-like Glu-specific endopeptidase